jgi:hypothetical protein
VLERHFEGALAEARAGRADPFGRGRKARAEVLRGTPETGVWHAAECSGRSRYDPAVASPTQPTEPGERPGSRRLERPPGERYRDATAPPAPTVTGATSARGVAWAAAVAIAGAVATTVLAGALNVTVGLLVVAGLTGRFIALALLAGGWPRRTAPAVAAAIALLGVAFGQVGIWLYARSEGGVLGPLDYLAQAFGWLVPLQLGIGAFVAWWSARSGTGG